VNVMSFDMKHYCRNFLTCPGRAYPDGDGSCWKHHTSRSEAEVFVNQSAHENGTAVPSLDKPKRRHTPREE
jgi:hypothetical protein